MAKELEELIQRVNRAVKSDQAMRTALTTVLAIHKPRIFQSGRDVNGGQIGQYSKKKISISRKRQARDTGHTVFEGGYAQYKQETGRGTVVNWRDTGQMEMDYGIIQNGNSFGFGFQNDLNYQKSQWLQEHFNKDVVDLTDQELNVLGDTLQAEVEKRI